MKLGDAHPNTLASMNNLANLYDNQERYQEAEPLYLKCLNVMTTKLGAAHPSTLVSMNNLGVFYHEHKRYEEAEPLLRECLDLKAVKLGKDHPSTKRTAGWLEKCIEALNM